MFFYLLASFFLLSAAALEDLKGIWMLHIMLEPSNMQTRALFVNDE